MPTLEPIKEQCGENLASWKKLAEERKIAKEKEEQEAKEKEEQGKEWELSMTKRLAHPTPIHTS